MEVSDAELSEFLKNAKAKNSPLLLCSGGTSSRCAANGHWTLDLRKGYSKIDFNEVTTNLEVEAGINMDQVQNELARQSRGFPTGLSGMTGLGYILTGGISPLSRSKGLAIDNILKIDGYWGSGEKFSIEVPNQSGQLDQRNIWRGLCGAAPFLGIITKLRLRTHPIDSLQVLKAKVKYKDLAKLILIAEEWPYSASLHWLWDEEIIILAVFINEDPEALKCLNSLLNRKKELFLTTSLVKIPGLSQLPPLSTNTLPEGKTNRIHSEVLGLLGPEWDKSCLEVINSINILMHNRPHPRCSIAAQQLGGKTTEIPRGDTSFVHRNAIWKPWITASWPAGDEIQRQKSLIWLDEVWKALERNCPGVHLAQMHPHLNTHKKEVKSAFKEWLPELQILKSRYDPKGLMPPL